MFRVLSLGLQVSTFAHLNCPACTTWPPPRPKAPANHATKTNECLTIIWKPKIYQKYSNVSNEKRKHTQNKTKITNDKNRDKVRRKTTTFEVKRNKRKPSASSIPVDLTDHAHRMFRRHAPRERRRHIHIRRRFFFHLWKVRRKRSENN